MKKGIQLKTLLSSAVILVSVLLSVFAIAGCHGGGTYNPPKYVQVVYTNTAGKSVNVEFGTLYDAFAWLNGKETGTAVGKSRSGGYLNDKSPDMTVARGDGSFAPSGSFQVIVLAQQANEGLSTMFPNSQEGGNQQATATVQEMAMSNPYASVTITTKNDFVINFKTAVAYFGYAHTTLDQMTVGTTAMDFFAQGNDITIGSKFANKVNVNVYGGTKGSGDGTTNADANSVTGLQTAGSHVVINGGNLNVVSGGNQQGGTFTGDSFVTVNAGSVTTAFGGSQAGTHTGEVTETINGGTVYSVMGAGGAAANQNSNVVVDVKGGTMKGIAGLGTINSGSMGGDVQVNMYGGTTGYLIGGSTAAMYAMPNSVEVNVYGGNIQNNLSATTLEGNSSTYSGTIDLNIIIEDNAVFNPPTIIHGNYNHNASSEVTVNIDTTKALNRPDFKNTKIYVADHDPKNDTNHTGGARLVVNAPDATFGDIYMSQNTNYSTWDPVSASFTGVQSIANYFGAPTTEGGYSVLNSYNAADVTFTNSTTAISGKLVGFKNLILDNSRVDMGTSAQVLPANSADASFYTSAQNGNLQLKNSSTLIVARPGSKSGGDADSAVFYDIISEGDANRLSAWTGTANERCAVTCLGTIQGDQMFLSVTTNAPTVKYAGNYNDLRAVIKHPATARGTVMPKAYETLYEVYWPADHTEYTYLGRTNDQQIRVDSFSDADNKTPTTSSVNGKTYASLQAALQAIKGAGASLHQRLTFYVDYAVTPADATELASTTTANVASLTFVSTTGDPTGTTSTPSSDAKVINFAQIKEWTLSTPTTLRNIKAAGLDNIYGNANAFTASRGVSYQQSATVATAKYINVYGGNKGATNGNTNVNIFSGTYAIVAGGTPEGANAMTGNTVVNIYGGTFSSEKTASISHQTAKESISDDLGGTAGLITAQYPSNGVISGGSYQSSGAQTGDVTLNVEPNPAFSFTAPKYVAGFYHSSGNISGSVSVNVTANNSEIFNSITAGGGSNAANVAKGATLSVDASQSKIREINGYQASDAGLAGFTGSNRSKAYNVTINLADVKYVSALNASEATVPDANGDNGAYLIANGPTATINVTGTVNAGNALNFSRFVVNGGTFDFVGGASNTANASVVAFSPCGSAEPSRFTGGKGNLVLQDGGMVDLMVAPNAMSYFSRVYGLESVGGPNTLNVVGVLTNKDTATSNDTQRKALLSIYGYCNINGNSDGQPLNLGNVNTSDSQAIIDAMENNQRFNLLYVENKTGAAAPQSANLSAAAGASGGYFDTYNLKQHYTSYLFQSATTFAGAVRTDAFKDYYDDYGVYIVAKEPTETNFKSGNVYIEKWYDYNRGTVYVTPSPDDPYTAGGKFYDTVALAANEIARADAGVDFTISMVSASGYTMTTNDAAALATIQNNTDAKSLTLKTDAGFDDQPREQAKQAYCVVKMNGVDMTFDVKNVTFTDMILDSGSIAGFSGASATSQPDIKLTNTVQQGTWSSYYGDTMTITRHYSKTDRGTSVQAHIGTMTGRDGKTYPVVDGIIYRPLDTANGETLDMLVNNIYWVELPASAGVPAGNYYNTNENYIPVSSTDLIVGNLNNLGSFEDQNPSRNLVVKGSINSPNGTLKLQSGKTLDLNPDSSAMGGISYNAATVGTSGSITINIPKGAGTGTIPMTVGNIPSTSVKVGINAKGGTIALSGDQLFRGGVVSGFNTTKYTENNNKLRGIPMTNEGGVSIHLKAEPGLHAQNFTIEDTKVYTSGTTYNMDEIILAAKAFVMGEDGHAVQGAQIRITNTALTNKVGTYDVTFAAGTYTKTVKGTVVSNIEDNPPRGAVEIVIPDTIHRGELSDPCVALNPITGEPVSGTTWSIVGGKDANGNPVDATRFTMATADPNGSGVYIDPNTGAIMIGRDAPEDVISQFTVQGTPPAATGFQPGTGNVGMPSKQPNDNGDAQPNADIEITTVNFDIAPTDIMNGSTFMADSAIKNVLVEKAEAMAYPQSQPRPTSGVYPVTVSDFDQEDQSYTGYADLKSKLTSGSYSDGEQVTIWYQATDANGFIVREKAIATLRVKEDQGIYARDFSIKADEVYKSGTTYNMDRILLLAKAYMVNEAGDKDIAASKGITISNTALTNKNGQYDVVFTGRVDGKTFTKTVKATVTDEQVINDDPADLKIVAPEGGVKPGMTSDPFVAQDPVTGEPISDVTWEVTKKDGTPVTDGTTMDPNTGRLTVPSTAAPGTEYTVTARPKPGTAAADKYQPGSLTFPLKDNGNVDNNRNSDVGIRGNNFTVGENQLTAPGVKLNDLVKNESHVKAWRESTKADMTPQVTVEDLGGLTTSAKAGQTFDIKFRITDPLSQETENYAEITLKATVVTNKTNGVWANDFEYGDELFNNDGTLKTNAKEMVITLAQAGAEDPATGELLPVTIPTLNLKKESGYAADVTFTCTENGGSVTTRGVYKDKSVVSPDQPVDPTDPNGDYQDDIQLTANDFSFGDEMFTTGTTMIPKANEMIMMLAQAHAKVVSTGAVLTVSVQGTPTLGKDPKATYPVTFTATNTETNKTKTITVNGTYKDKSQVKPTDPVNPTPDDPKPDYGDDIQITANSPVIVAADKLGPDKAAMDKALQDAANAVAKKVSNGESLPITVTTAPSMTPGNVAPGKYEVTYTATNPDTGKSASVTSTVTVSDASLVKINASDFEIAKSEVYTTGTTLNTVRILQLAKAYFSDATGAPDPVASDLIQIDTANTTLTNVIGDGYKVAFKATVNGQNYTATVNAKVVSDMDIQDDPSELEVSAPAGGVKNDGQPSDPFTASDPLTKKPITDVTWSVSDPSGNPVSGVTMDPNTGKLTVPSSVPANTDLKVTATPKPGTDAANKYEPGSLTFPVKTDGKVDPKPNPDVAISANDFVVDITELNGNLTTLARTKSGVRAWRWSTNADLTSNVSVDLGGLTTNAKYGETYPITFRITDTSSTDMPNYAEVTVKATVGDKTQAGIQAHDFPINRDEIYSSGSTVDSNRLAELADAKVNDANGIPIPGAVINVATTFPANPADVDNGGIYDVTFTSPAAPGGNKTVQATVIPNDIDPDPSDLKVVPPMGDTFAPGTTSKPFTAVDPQDGQEVPNVTWAATDPTTGNPIPGVTIDPDGKLTVPSTVPTGTKIEVTATPPAGTNYNPGSTTIEVGKPGGNDTDVAIKAHDFIFGTNRLQSMTAADIVNEAKKLAGASAWHPSDMSAINASDITVTIAPAITNATASDKNKEYTVTFTIADAAGKEASVDVKAKIADYVFFEPAASDLALAAWKGTTTKDAISADDLKEQCTPQAWVLSSGYVVPDSSITVDPSVIDPDRIVDRDHPVTFQVPFTATNPQKPGTPNTVTGNVDVTVGLDNPEVEFSFTDADKKVVLTGTWNNDDTHTFTVKMKVKGNAATAVDFQRVTIRPTAVGGFEEVGNWDLFNTSDLKLTYTGVQDGYGVATFTVTSKKSGIVRYSYLFDGTAQNPNLYSDVIVPGDVDRNGRLTAMDSFYVGQTVLGNSHDYTNSLYNLELCNMDASKAPTGEETVSAYDSAILGSMVLGQITPSN